jgi:hypothetical protein
MLTFGADTDNSWSRIVDSQNFMLQNMTPAGPR